MTDVDYQEPTGRPEEFGLPQAATPDVKRLWDRQEMFLAAYREFGRINKAAAYVGLSRWAVVNWERSDAWEFRRRMEAAHADYCEAKIEGLIDSRLADPTGNRGSDILLMFKAKAEMPHKYREEVRVIDTTPTRDLLVKLRAIGAPRIVDGSVSTIGPAEVSNVPAPPLSVSESEVVE